MYILTKSEVLIVTKCFHRAMNYLLNYDSTQRFCVLILIFFQGVVTPSCCKLLFLTRGEKRICIIKSLSM